MLRDTLIARRTATGAGALALAIACMTSPGLAEPTQGATSSAPAAETKSEPESKPKSAEQAEPAKSAEQAEPAKSGTQSEPAKSAEDAAKSGAQAGAAKAEPAKSDAPAEPAKDQAKSSAAGTDAQPAAAASTSEKPSTPEQKGATNTPADSGEKSATSPAPSTTGTITPAASTPATGGDTSAAETPAATPSTETAPAAAATPPADPLLTAIRTKLGNASVTGKSNKDDVSALVAFYADRTTPPLWVDKDGFTAKATSAMAEIRKADDWGLSASAFELPSLASGQTSPDDLAAAEVKLGLSALKYARFARGGRVNPSSLSRILDQTPPVKDPKEVLAAFEQQSDTGAYLRSLQPKHEQFLKLRQVLLKARGGPTPDQEPVDEALKVKIPAGKMLKPGATDETVALLRKRLKVPAEAGTAETLFDPKLADAVKAFQKDKGINPSGNINSSTRQALNAEGEPKRAAPEAETQRILINMERWRWMPEHLGEFYVWDNVPEFIARVVKSGKEIFREKIIVGQPDWATPTFSADMQYIVFNPSWGVPDGIKVRELLPRLRSASGGFFFFGGGGGDVLRAYGLTAYRGGRAVDPDSVDWGNVDIRSYSFVQPPGGKNPLGFVKFRFPNKHDVYMHDTVQRELFGQSYRALSHGCMRVQNPRRLADLLLLEDKGWSPDRVGDAIATGNEIALTKPIPVHVTYFTALVDESGKVSTYPDIYGHDSRLSAALSGRAIRFESAVETASSDDDDGPPPLSTQQPRKVKKKYSPPDNLADAISGLLGN